MCRASVASGPLIRSVYSSSHSSYILYLSTVSSVDTYTAQAKHAIAQCSLVPQTPGKGVWGTRLSSVVIETIVVCVILL